MIGGLAPCPPRTRSRRRYTCAAPLLCRAGFREPPQGELRGITLPRTRANKGMQKGQGMETPALLLALFPSAF